MIAFSDARALSDSTASAIDLKKPTVDRNGAGSVVRLLGSDARRRERGKSETVFWSAPLQLDRVMADD
jgi:hypothetical protein